MAWVRCPDMRKAALLLASVLALGGCRHEAPRPVSVGAIIDADRAFLQVSTLQAALLEHLAEQSIILAPAPQAGRPWAHDKIDTSLSVEGWPRFAEIANSGDFGYTTGAWRHLGGASQGSYVSVWRRPEGGPWRMEITACISHDEYWGPGGVDTTATEGWVRARRKLYQEAARVSMLKADRDLALASVDGGAAAAFASVLADSAVAFRHGDMPLKGKAAVAQRLDLEGGILTWVPIDAAISRAGDLGYTYGIRTLRADSALASRSYLRIWKSQPDSSWRIVVNLTTRVLQSRVAEEGTHATEKTRPGQ